MQRLVLPLSFFVLLSGCWASHLSSPARSDGGVGCDVAEAPICVTRASPCDALELAGAECRDAAWSCPAGSVRHAPVWADDRCLPLFGRLDGLLLDGVHEAPVPVPIGARCAWVFPLEGGDAHLAAVDVATSCDALGDVRPISSSGEGFDYLAVGASIRVASETRVLLRGWLFDPLAPFGVRSVGVGLGRMDGDSIAIGDWLFGAEDVDLGDAAVVDGAFAYVYGSPDDPHWLEEDAIVARAPLASVDERRSWSILGAGGWGAGDPVRVFGTGPHRGPVVRDPSGGFLHVYAIGFGREILAARAPSPEGPWSGPTTLVECELPSGDPGAFCAGPYPHIELFDLTRPSELVVSYSVGTVSTDGDERRRRDPAGYWPRVIRVRR